MVKNIFSNLNIFKWSILQNITYEPTILLYFISTHITDFLGNNLILRKSCDPTALVEPDLRDGCLNEVAAQYKVTEINSWKLLLRMLISAVVMVIAGPWSDTYGRRRRPLIFMPVIGHIITDTLLSFTAYYWYLPAELTAIIEAVTVGLSGAMVVLWIGTVSYISDNTSLKNRTWRLGVLAITFEASNAIGSFIAGYMNVNFGFIGSYLLSMSMNIVGLTLGILLIKDTSVPHEKPVKFIKTVYQSIFGLYELATKKRCQRKRLCFWIVLFSKLFIMGRTFGEKGLLYLFVRYKFSWDEIQYGIFVSFKIASTLVGSCFSFGVMSYWLKMNDALIGLIGAFTDATAVILYFFAYEPWQMYVVTIFDIFTGATIGVSTSILTKCVEPDEQGKMCTLEAVVMLITPVVICPLYFKLYSLTLQTLPGAFFIFSAVLLYPTIIFFIMVYNISKKSGLMDQKEKEEDNDDNEAQIDCSKSANGNGNIQTIS